MLHYIRYSINSTVVLTRDILLILFFSHTIFTQTVTFLKTITIAENNTVPNPKAKATDGNPVFTPRQWLERLKQFTKREHKVDTTRLLKREDITDITRTSNPRRFYLGSATGSTLPDNPSWVQNGTG